MRAKISVTVDPRLLRAVDEVVATDPELDRSRVFEEALELWYARRQAEAMLAQFQATTSPQEDTERQDWKQTRRQAARRRFGREPRK